MGPRRRIALAAPAGVLLVALLLWIVLGGGGGPSGRPSPKITTASPGTGFDGAALPSGRRAAVFTLTDQSGKSVSLGEFRGRVTVLTFLYAACGAPCVVIAQQIRGALDELKRPVGVLIVSADPRSDTPQAVERFLAAVSLSGRVHYLTGTLAHLRPVWSAYRVRPASSGRAQFARYASVLLIDREGDERVLYQSEQLTAQGLAYDIGKLDGDPTDP